MTTYTWKIQQLQQKDGLICYAKYHLTANDGEITVATEGHCEFPADEIYRFTEDIKEKNIGDWIDGITNGAVKSNLDSQIEALKTQQQEVELPWVANIFIPQI